jgi:hypothetical protein
MSEKIKGMAEPPTYTTTLLDEITSRDGRISKKLFEKVVLPKIERLESENADLKERFETSLVIIGDEGPELSCPFIDVVIMKFPETKATMSKVRTINEQLRYNLIARMKQVAHLESGLSKERAKSEKLLECVRFYGDEKNHDPFGNMQIIGDSGKRARACIKEIRG